MVKPNEYSSVTERPAASGCASWMAMRVPFTAYPG
jgi:hypothetical protein